MYTPLYIKTDYSLLSSLIKLDDLMKKLKQLGLSSCAICDDNLYGTMEFIHKCKSNNIKPIIGLDLKDILLFAKTSTGYYNLVKLETYKNFDKLDIDILKKYKDDLICITFNLEDYNKYNFFSNIYMGVNNKKDEELFKDNNPVYINKTLYLDKALYKYLPYVFMIRDGKKVDDSLEFTYRDNYLYSYDELIDNFSSTTINNTNVISDMCNITLKNELFMPKYDVENPKDYLRKLSLKGLKKRLEGNVTKSYLDRLNYELDVIISMNFEDYFLVVYDYIKYAKTHDILVGPGRGSAAGSLVSYCLGITEVDPLKYDLLFERFLNKDRITMPDIDTDFPDDKRDEVIEYVKEKYGSKNVAGIITFGTLGGRAAVRDVGRVLNCNPKYIDIICKKIPFKGTLKELKQKDKEINLIIENDSKLKTLYNIVNLLEGAKRHTSQHAAGIVISKEPLSNIVPVKKSEEINLTEYTMDYLEEQGLIKMDFLGIKNLSIINNILKDIEKNTGKKLDFNKIPSTDSNVMKLFQNGDTTGIFQFESSGMRRFLRDLKPDSFECLCDAIALFRPGPASSIPSYIKRKEKKEKITYLDPCLENILKPTKGIIIYQEQIMKIAREFAGFTLSEADILRRAMSKKKLEVLKAEEDKFIKGALEKGHNKEISKKIFDLILAFAGYGFNKSHSVSYSIIAYRMAYLKRYFPKEFYSSLLSGVVGSEEKTKEYLSEVKKLGIKVLPPDINRSDSNKYIVDGNDLLFPLSGIRNVGSVIANYIVEKRDKEYKDIYDFISRTREKTNNKRVLESLIYSHSFDKFYNISTLINNIDNILNYVELSSNLDESLIEKPVIEESKNNDDSTISEKEKELFGFYLTSHATEKYKLNDSVIDINNLPKYLNKDVDIIVMVEKIKEVTTKKKDIMAFANSSDNTGDITFVLFPDIYETYKDTKKGDIVKINGRVERRFNEYQVVCKTLEKIN